MPFDDIIEKHSRRVGIDPAWMRKIMRIESGGDPSNVTGSYKGLFQLSSREFKAGGGSGNILDPDQNTMAAANKLAREKLAFKEKYGQDPSLTDLYMVHQQGEAGYGAHKANPSGTAWENIRKYYKSDAVAKSAVWGNVPDNLKSKFGSVENITSQDFVNMWGTKVEAGEFESGPSAVASAKMGRRGTFLGEEPAGEPAKPRVVSDPVRLAFTDFQVPELVPEFGGTIKSRALQ